jgi:putative ABC transport system permease protein
MSYVVTERRRELAIRMAIGARPGQLVGLIGRQSTVMLVIGLAAGLAGAFAVNRLLPGLLTGVHRLDAAPIAASIGVLLAAAAVGLSIPAWRASRVDPIRTLRQE